MILPLDWTVNSPRNQAELQLRFRNNLIIDNTATPSMADTAFDLNSFPLQEDRVPGDYGLAKLDLVRTHKISDLALIFGFAQQHDAGKLRHCLKLQYAGHNGMPGEVSLEKRLVDGHGFDPCALVVSLKLDNAIQQKEGVAMGENLHHLVDVQGTLAGGEC